MLNNSFILISGFNGLGVILMVDLYKTGEALINPFVELWNGLVELIPGLIAALALAIVGWFISSLLGKGIEKIFVKLNVDKKMEKSGLTDKLGHLEISHITGEFVKWYLFIIFLADAFQLINLGTLSLMITSFLSWLPNMLLGLVLMVLGLLFADFVAVKMEKTKIKSIRIIADILKIVIVFFVAIIALKQMGLYVTIAETTFLVLISGVSLALALAIGIGFGLALKDEAKDVIRGLKKKL